MTPLQQARRDLTTATARLEAFRAELAKIPGRIDDDPSAQNLIKSGTHTRDELIQFANDRMALDLARHEAAVRKAREHHDRLAAAEA